MKKLMLAFAAIAAMLGAKADLPSGYEAVSAIKSTGVQMIDLGIPLKSTYQVEMDFVAESLNSSTVIFGARDSATSKNFAACWDADNGLCVDFDNYKNTRLTYKITTGKRYYLTVRHDLRELREGGAAGAVVQTQDTSSTTVFDTPGSCYLFSMNRPSSQLKNYSRFSGVLYSFKITDMSSNALVMNLVPCRNSENVIGLYDTVGGQFYTTKDTDPFTVPGIAPGTVPTGYEAVSAIKSTGSQVIDLGITLKNTYQVEMDFEAVTLNSSTVIFGARDSATSKNFAACWDANNGICIDFYNHETSRLKYKIAAGTRYYMTIRHDLRELKGGGVDESNSNDVTTEFETSRTCHLFSMNRPSDQLGNYRKFSGVLYSFKITDISSTQLVMDLVPCKNPNGVIGMYNTVGEKFYTTAEGDPFIVPGALPEGYSKLDYVQSWGEQWVVTDFAPTTTDKLEFKASFDRLEQQCLFCSRGTGENNNPVTCFVGNDVEDWKFRFGRYNTSSIWATNGTVLPDTDYKVVADFNSLECTINDSHAADLVAGDFTVQSWLVLLASHTLGQYVNGNRARFPLFSDRATCKLYYFRETDAKGVLTHDLVPARRESDGICGFWDMIGAKFYKSEVIPLGEPLTENMTISVPAGETRTCDTHAAITSLQIGKGGTLVLNGRQTQMVTTDEVTLDEGASIRVADATYFSFKDGKLDFTPTGLNSANVNLYATNTIIGRVTLPAGSNDRVVVEDGGVIDFDIGSGCKVELKNGATRYESEVKLAFANHPNATLVLDNASIKVPKFYGTSNSRAYAGCEGSTLIFTGVSPQLNVTDTGDGCVWVTGTDNDADGIVLSYVIPNDGYVARESAPNAAPICITGGKNTGARIGGNTRISVAMENSEFRHKEMVIPLVYDVRKFTSNGSGVEADLIDPVALTAFNKERIPRRSKFVLSDDKTTLCIALPDRTKGLILVIQ